jgi:RNA polymerase sigma factor (TIGR02999 family)
MTINRGARVTQLLVDWGRGDEAAFHRLLPLVHSELRRLARSYMRRERKTHTLQATALVNEAYLRLVDQQGVEWNGRAHFFGIAAREMRRILVDHARKRGAEKRGGGASAIPLDGAIEMGEAGRVDLVALDDALKDLETLDPRQHRVVELKYFGGLSIDEIAEVMRLSPATVKREWATAKLWLAHALGAKEAR